MAVGLLRAGRRRLHQGAQRHRVPLRQHQRRAVHRGPRPLRGPAPAERRTLHEQRRVRIRQLRRSGGSAARDLRVSPPGWGRAVAESRAPT